MKKLQLAPHVTVKHQHTAWRPELDNEAYSLYFVPCCMATVKSGSRNEEVHLERGKQNDPDL